MRQEKDKEARVELLRRQMVRRMMNANVANAWGAWVELWEAKTYAMGRLLEVRNRLSQPELSKTFGFWARDAMEAKQQAELKALEVASKSLEAQLRRSRHESSQLEMLRAAHVDEIHALKERVATLADEMRDKDSGLGEALALRKEHAEVTAALEAARTQAATAERLHAEAEADLESQRTANQELLERLLAEQRRSFEEERQQLRMVYSGSAEVLKVMEEGMEQQVAALREENARVHDQLGKEEELTTRMGKETREASEACGRLRTELAGLREESSAYQSQLMVAREESSRLEKDLAMAKTKGGFPSPPDKKARAAHKKGGTSVLGNFVFLEGPDAPSITEQIAGALRSQSSRVLDLFREWDTDGDGEVSRKEFRKAMPELGLNVDLKEIDALFDMWDADGGGSLEFKELTKILRTSTSTRPASLGNTPAAAPVTASKPKKKVK